MRLLVLGGTAFLGRAVVRTALVAGHDVTCAARGVSGEPESDARFIRVDRDHPDGPAPLHEMEFDALLDVSRQPSHVRRAVAELAPRVGHAVYVSSASAYADNSTPGQRAADGFGADRAFVCRAGLIIGPEDDTNRFGYWVSRLAQGGEVLAPGAPDDLVQYVDVRDLVDPEFLLSEGVRPWMGERSLPLWLPLPEYAGFLSRDVSASLDAGLRTRDVTDTARDTLAWLGRLETAPGNGAGLTPEHAGLTSEDEASLLEKWHSRTS